MLQLGVRAQQRVQMETSGLSSLKYADTLDGSLIDILSLIRFQTLNA